MHLMGHPKMPGLMASEARPSWFVAAATRAQRDVMAAVFRWERITCACLMVAVSARAATRPPSMIMPVLESYSSVWLT